MMRSMNEQEMHETIGESWYTFGWVVGAVIVLVATAIILL